MLCKTVQKAAKMNPTLKSDPSIIQRNDYSRSVKLLLIQTPKKLSFTQLEVDAGG